MAGPLTAAASPGLSDLPVPWCGFSRPPGDLPLPRLSCFADQMGRRTPLDHRVRVIVGQDIAASWNRLDQRSVGTERFAQGCHLEAQIAFLDDRAWPHERNDGGFFDHASLLGKQQVQEIECAASKLHRTAIAKQQPRARQQAPTAEAEFNGRQVRRVLALHYTVRSPAGGYAGRLIGLLVCRLSPFLLKERCHRPSSSSCGSACSWDPLLS